MKLLLKKICEIVIVEGGSKHNFFTTKMLREILFRVTSKNEEGKTPNETVAVKMFKVIIVVGYARYNFLTTKVLREILFHVTSKNEARKTPYVTVAKKNL